MRNSYSCKKVNEKYENEIFTDMKVMNKKLRIKCGQREYVLEMKIVSYFP